MRQHQFTVAQDEDGLWFYYSKDNERGSPWEHFPTREECERAAEEFAAWIQKVNEIEEQTKARMMRLIQEWTDQLVQESGLDREEVLFDIGIGIKDAVDELCPAG